MTKKRARIPIPFATSPIRRGQFVVRKTKGADPRGGILDGGIHVFLEPPKQSRFDKALEWIERWVRRALKRLR